MAKVEIKPLLSSLSSLRAVLYAQHPDDLKASSKLDSAHKAQNADILVLKYAFLNFDIEFVNI